MSPLVDDPVHNIMPITKQITGKSRYAILNIT